MIRQIPLGRLVVNADAEIKRHLAVAKAWVKFTPTGGVHSAYNVSTATGINRITTGHFTVYFQKHFSATGNFTAIATAQGSGIVLYCAIQQTSSDSVEVRTLDANAGAYSETNLAFVSLACFGVQ